MMKKQEAGVCVTRAAITPQWFGGHGWDSNPGFVHERELRFWGIAVSFLSIEGGYCAK